MKSYRKWGTLLIAAALALLGALANGAVGLADDYRCTGSPGPINVDNLYVPQDASCTLSGTIVSGNIFVEKNATLNADDIQVNGNIQAENAASVNVYSGSFVKGKIQILRSGAAEIESVGIGGDLHFENNTLFLKAANNDIGGNLQAFKNTGGIAITGNTIDGNLQCDKNNPPPIGAGNIVKGNEEGQCAGFGGNPTPSPTQTSLPPTQTSLPPTQTSLPPTQTTLPPTQTTLPLTPTSLPPTNTAIARDQESPSVQWIAPVQARQRYDIREGEQVVLEVQASDNGSILQVTFMRWDALNERHVTLGTLVQPPYRITISASNLNPGWNQVFVQAVDLAGNRSDYPYIWFYQIVQQGQSDKRIYLPFIGK